MSTPHQGPGQWEPGNFPAATDYLANLNAQQQQNLHLVLNMTQEQAQKLERMLNKQPLRARIHNAVGNAVARVHEVYDRTTERLSEAAQSLATQARQFRQAAVGTANLVAQGVAQGYRDVRDDVVDRAQRGAVAADLAAQRVGEGINAAGRTVAQATRQGVVAQGGAGHRSSGCRGRPAGGGGRAATGRQRVPVVPGQEGPGPDPGRGRTRVLRRVPDGPDPAAGGREPAGTPGAEPAVQQGPGCHDPQARVAAVQELLQTTQTQVGAQENAQNMSVALGGVAPAGRATGPGQAVGTDQGNEQGAQSTVNLTKNPPTKGGPTLGG